MTAQTISTARATWRDYLTLCKPRVVLLMLLCAVVGMLLAVPALHLIPLEVLVFGTGGIALVAASAATVNHIADARIDVHMARTQHRPMATGRISLTNSLLFAATTGISGIVVLLLFTNPLTVLLNLTSWVGYGLIYTLFLKHSTSQNIVIGGLFGAAPPLFGWAAVTNSIEAGALLLVLIIFTWTPPHFWALALDRKDEYRKAAIPMLPVTHGVAYTKKFILFYTLLLSAASMLPFVIGMSGALYLFGVLILNARFLWLVAVLLRGIRRGAAFAVFRYSITYLALLSVLLLLDHYLLPGALPIRLQLEG